MMGADYRVALTLKSANRKTGPIPVSTTTFATCPDACALKDAGCYAAGGPLALHWRKVTAGERGGSWSAFCDQISALPIDQLWRHNQAGDLPGDRVDIDPLALAYLVKANRGRRGFAYTHYAMSLQNRTAVRIANANGFTINLSADNLDQADDYAGMGLPTVTLLPSDTHGRQTLRTPQGRKVVVCPATYRDDVSCASCALCQRRDRDCIVGFPAHGSSKLIASKVFHAAGR